MDLPEELRKPHIVLRKVKADAYFCCIRSWWDGAGVDAALWRKHDSKCYLRTIKTGQTFTPTPPRSDTESPIDTAKFDLIRSSVLAMEFHEIPQQTEWLCSLHYDYWFGLKTSSSDSTHWLKVRTGKHTDPRVERLLALVYEQAPRLCIHM